MIQDVRESRVTFMKNNVFLCEFIYSLRHCAGENTNAGRRSVCVCIELHSDTEKLS